MAGLALGGGWGWLSRKYGMTVDNIRAVDLVTANGELVRASEDENPELYWGIRGGSGNFGVVTTFEFDLYALDYDVLGGAIIHPIADAREVLQFWREFASDAPEEVGGLAARLIHVHPEMPLPEDLHGNPVLLLRVLYVGQPEEGEVVLAPLRDFGDPLHDTVRPMRYETSQQRGEAPDGMRHYWKSHYLEGLPDKAIDEVVERALSRPTGSCPVNLFARGGAINSVDANETAFPHRDATFHLEIQANWVEANRDREHIEWARDVYEPMEPYSTGGVYGNVPNDDQPTAAYGENYDRLAEIKAAWNPENLFRLNQNIEPTV